jgi:Iap family predicted aminopeptidase
MEVEVNNTIVKKGYEFLRELCSFNADFNAFGYGKENPITNRVQYIMNRLDKHNIPYTVDKFQPVNGVPDYIEGQKAYVNIVVEIEGENKYVTTVFLAHHDVVNLGTADKVAENCNDNTASVANLLDLAVRLSEKKPANNVVIAFVDAEEAVAPPICGSQRLAQNILKGKYGHVKYAVNLELTANGRNYWMSYNKNDNALAHHIREIHPNTHRVRTPYNDAFILEREGVASVCVGSLKDNELADVKTKGYCRTWAMCHNINDTFESQAVEADMDLFVNWLETLI